MKNHVLSHGDFTRIAIKAGLSLSTVQKYFGTEQVSLRPETKLKIMVAYKDYLKDKSFGLQSYLNQVEHLLGEVQGMKTTVETALQNLQIAINE